MGSKVIAVLFVLVGLINLVPVVGVGSAQRLQRLYGVWVAEPDLLLLMRHRAVLLGLVGGLLLVAAFQESLRPAASWVGLISMLSFVVLGWGQRAHNPLIARVVAADLVASALLVGALVLAWISQRR
ncbi:MAG: phosphopantetheine adenylyltransferase [Myxococcota bacterium]|nr:phosphopantetheine adenylyltransferase [Myxococcota bacterium]